MCVWGREGGGEGNGVEDAVIEGGGEKKGINRENALQEQIAAREAPFETGPGFLSTCQS